MEKILGKHLNCWFCHIKQGKVEGVKILTNRKKRDALLLAGYHVCPIDEGDLLLLVTPRHFEKYVVTPQLSTGRTWQTRKDGNKYVYVRPITEF